MKTRMRLRALSGGGVCRAEHNGKKCQKLWTGEVLPLDGSLLMGDSSDASFQQAFMDISGPYPMKALYTQRVRIPLSSSVGSCPAGDSVARRCGHDSYTMARRFPRWRKIPISANMAVSLSYPSTCAKAASAWGSQNVISMARYISMAVA